MADLTVRAHDLPTLPWPRICARTGQPTASTVKLTAVEYPSWTVIGVVFGILPWILLRMMVGGRKVSVNLPHVTGRAGRRRVAFVGILVLLPVAMVFGMAAMFEPSPVVYAVLAASLAGMVGLGVLWARNLMVRMRWVDATRVKLVGVHPEFVAALKRGPEQPVAAPAMPAMPAMPVVTAPEPAPAAEPQPDPSALAGWHPDPSGEFVYRYFDGTQWTEHVSNGVTQSA